LSDKELGNFFYKFLKIKMTQIDKSKPVLVTGATGYIAGWLVKRLLEE